MRQLSRPLIAITTPLAIAILAVLLLSQGPPASEAAGSADVKVQSLVFGTPNGSNQCVNPAPATIPVNTDVSVCTRLSFHNNGPMSPADVSINRTVAFVPQGNQPAGECTITPTGGLLTFNNVNASTTLTRDETYVVNCSKPSDHKFRVQNDLSPGPAGTTDPDTSNNSATVDLDVGVTAVADFSIVSQEIRDADCVSPAPTAILANADTVFCLVKTVHNGGPYGPTAADIFFRSEASADCTVVPFVDSNGAQLQVSVNFTLTELFTLNCTEASFHSFTVENFLEPTDPHVTDPDGVSYMATTQTVAVLGQADLKITSQTATAPPSVQPGQPFTVTVDKTLHNNGPYGPVPVSITTDVSAPADCTVVPDPGNPTSASLAVSTALPATEIFTVTCSDPSFHEIVITNCLASTEPHATDPTPGNDCQTSTVNVTISIDADLKITSQTLDAPPSATAGQAFDLTVLKTLHNNGPFSPAPGIISSTVTAPADCTVVPDPGNPSSVTLVSSIATPVNEVFSITCADSSFHEFTVVNCFDPLNIHVIDSDPGNNCQSDSVTIPIFGEADVKITAQELVDPPPAPIDRVALDMDPASAPANTITSLGTTEDCGAVTVGGTITFDVIVDSVPAYAAPSGGISGFDFFLNFDDTKVKVTAVNAFLILTANGGTIPFPFIDATPDTVSPFHIAVADFGANPPESGAGVLASITLEGVAAGTSPLTLTTLLLADGNNDGYVVNNVLPGEVRVEGTCPAPPTPTPSPSPTPSPTPTPIPTPTPELTFDVGEAFGLKLNKTLHNNGPFGPVEVSITPTFSAPADCTVIPSPGNPPLATLPVSTAVIITETFQASCSQPSEHVFTFTNCIAPTDPHVSDPNTQNNCQESSITVFIIAQADLKVSAQTIDAPPDAPVGQPFAVTIDKTVHNNGPLSPAPANVVTTVSAPADCNVVADPGNPTSLSLTASTSQDLSELYTITCSDPSLHVISVTNCIETADPHLSDPDSGNNCQTSAATVAVTADADLKISAQEFYAADCTSAPPLILPPFNDLDICVVTTVHNNGPFTPVDADLDITIGSPAGCTATPSAVSQTFNGMQASVSQSVQQVITLHCTTGGVHDFTFDSALIPADLHVVDPVSPNHLRSEVFDILSEEADPKITAVVVDCPDSAITGQPFDCAVDVTVHNNGPASPVSVDIETELTPPFDCNVSPGTQTIPASLIASTSQVLTFTWTVVCGEFSFHTFVANANLIVTHPGLLELNPNNNSGTGQDTTAVNDEVDVKVTAVTGSAPASVPLDTPFDIDVDVTLHNNGPTSPIKIEGGHGVAVPSDCTIAPGVSQVFNITSLDASTTVVVTKTFTVSCSAAGDHEFVVCGRAGPSTLHVLEESQYNNFMNGPILVNVGGNSPTLVPTVGCSIPGDPPEVCGDGVDNDGDTLIDEEPDTDLDGDNDCIDDDDDDDGFTDIVEQYVGTDPLNDCARGPFDSAWPPDFDNNQAVNITDILSMKPVFGTSVGDATYEVRRDITADGNINISDVTGLKPYFGIVCS